MPDKLRLIRALEGISAVSVTPFDKETGGIDFAALDANMEFLLAGGIEVIVPCGNTGEYYALTPEERLQVAEAAMKRINGRAFVVVGIGGDVQSAIESGRHAQRMGAHAVMIHQPVIPFFTEEGLIDYYREIVDSLDLYSIPYIKSRKTGRDVYEFFMTRSKVIAVKYAIPDAQLFAETILSLPAWDAVWICGLAEMWAPFFQRAGSRGFTSGLANVAPEKSRAMLDALRSDNSRAIMKVWEEIAPFEELRAKYDNGINVTVVKEAMNALGYNGGNVRSPAHELNGEDRRMLLSLLNRWGKIHGEVSH